MSIKRLFQIMFGLFFLFITGLIILAALLFVNQRDLEKSEKLRYDSYVLATLLRRTSDDLTRFARAYVVTGEPRFETYYRDILAIRNGAKPRPEHYDWSYWDYVAATGTAPRLAGQAVSMDQLLKNAGITQAEFARLHEAEASSNALVKTEEMAMHAVKGLYDDGTGKFIKQGQPNRDWAVKILFDEAYHQEKMKIMKPIDEFFAMLDARTWRATEKYELAARRYLHLIIGLLILLFILTLTSFTMISSKVYSSFKAFTSFFSQGAKRYSWIEPEQVNFKEFQEMAAQANEMVKERHETEATIRERTERLNLTLEATGIGIWERDLHKKTFTWDKAAQSILGLSMDPLTGHQQIFLNRIQPDDLERVRNETRQAINEGTRAYSTEFRVIWPDASLHTVASRAVVVRDDWGAAVRMIGACWDITDAKQREQLALLASEVGDALTSFKPIQEKLQLCAEVLVRRLDAALARLWTVNQTGDLLEMQASAGIHTHTDGAHSQVPVGTYKIGRIAQEAQVRFSNELWAESDIDDKEWVRQHGLVSFMGHPLIFEDRVVGVMGFFSRYKLNPDTMQGLVGIAKTIAVAIDRERAERKLEEALGAIKAVT